MKRVLWIVTAMVVVALAGVGLVSVDMGTLVVDGSMGTGKG